MSGSKIPLSEGIPEIVRLLRLANHICPSPPYSIGAALAFQAAERVSDNMWDWDLSLIPKKLMDIFLKGSASMDQIAKAEISLAKVKDWWP